MSISGLTAKSLDKLKNKKLVTLGIIFCIFLFFRFFQLEERAQFTWDQVDFAWNAKNIIIEHKYPLVGMVAKQNTGIFMGPAYYYLTAFFYWFFNLDPIASPIFAGVVSIVSFIAFFYVTKKIFGENVAFVATILYTFSNYFINADRIQWSVNFIPLVSFIIFYALYNILQNKPKYFLLFAAALGFSFHIHFTSIVYVLIFLCISPLIPRSRKNLLYALCSIPVLLVWFVPSFIAQMSAKNPGAITMVAFFNSSFHGVHLRRLIQIAPDAFVEFNTFTLFRVIEYAKFLLVPVFVYFFFLKSPNKKKFLLLYLIGLWFLVPWLVLGTFRGELSQYYFALTRPIAIWVSAYLLGLLLFSKNYLAKSVAIIYLIIFAYVNVGEFAQVKMQGIAYHKKIVYQKVKRGEGNMFLYGAPDSYLHYYYREIKKINE